MNPTMYRIITYTFRKSNPTKYPLSLDAEEEIVFSRSEMEQACFNNFRDATLSPDKRLCCMVVQELEIDDSGRFMLLDEEIRYCPPFSNEGGADCDIQDRFICGDVVEVIDDYSLTLGIIVHIPHQYYYNDLVGVTIGKPHLHYRFSVLLYKPNGRIKLEQVKPTHLLRTYALEADSQITALRTASENICVQE